MREPREEKERRLVSQRVAMGAHEASEVRMRNAGTAGATPALSSWSLDSPPWVAAYPLAPVGPVEKGSENG